MTDENPYAPPEADIEVPTTTDPELASRGARLGGSIVDGLVLGVIFWGAIFATDLFDRVAEAGTSVAAAVAFMVGWVAVFLLVNGYLLAVKGQTIGKLAVGTRIVSIHDGRILPLWKLMGLRYLPFFVIGYVPVVGAILGLINPLFIFRQDYRCLHDHLAGTKVVVATTLPETQ